jgi:hypothetical protein
MLGLGGGKGGTTGPPSLDDVCEMLDALHLKYFTDPNRRAILLSFKGDTQDHDLYILVDKERSIVYLAVVRYLEVPTTHPRLNEILRRLMELNWKMSLGKFEWDPSDGEVRLCYAFTTEDGLGVTALGVIIGYLVQAADNYYQELHALAA